MQEKRKRKKVQPRSGRPGIEIPKTHTKQPFQRQKEGIRSHWALSSLVAVGNQARDGELIGFQGRRPFSAMVPTCNKNSHSRPLNCGTRNGLAHLNHHCRETRAPETQAKNPGSATSCEKAFYPSNRVRYGRSDEELIRKVRLGLRHLQKRTCE